MFVKQQAGRYGWSRLSEEERSRRRDEGDVKEPVYVTVGDHATTWTLF